MGEYDRREQKIKSRVISNNGGGSRQLKSFVDNHSPIIRQMQHEKSFSKKDGILQREAYFYEKPVVMSGGPNHYHIGFDSYHTFKHPIHIYQPEESERHKNALVTNHSKDVGFGAHGGFSSKICNDDGELFTYYNGIVGAGGKVTEKISNTDNEDKALVRAIDKIGPEHKYNILGFNCQKWYLKVMEEYEKLRPYANIIVYPTPDSKTIRRENADDETTPLLGHYYGADELWDVKEAELTK